MRQVCSGPVYLPLRRPLASHSSSTLLQHRSARHLQRRLDTCACAYPGKPQILKEPATRDATLGELLVEISDLPRKELQQLVDLGAVYYGDPGCPANPPKWRRAKRLGAAAMDEHISEVPPLHVCCFNASPMSALPRTGCMHVTSTDSLDVAPCAAACYDADAPLPMPPLHFCSYPPHMAAYSSPLCRGSGLECTPDQSDTQRPAQLIGHQLCSTWTMTSVL